MEPTTHPAHLKIKDAYGKIASIRGGCCGPQSGCCGGGRTGESAQGVGDSDAARLPEDDPMTDHLLGLLPAGTQPSEHLTRMIIAARRSAQPEHP